jgi:signal transduction histidine kinase
LKKIIILWEALSNIGIDNQVSQVERKKIRVLNQTIIIALGSQFFACINYLINFELLIMTIGFGIISLILFLLYLNYIKKFQLARNFVNGIIPLLLVCLGMLYGEGIGIQYNLIIFVTTALFFSQRLITKLSFVIYDVALYFFLRYYWNNYDSLMTPELTNFEQDIAFVATVAIIIVLLFFSLKENEDFNKKNQLLLDSLERNNKELKRANEGLERFAYIASHDLKTPLRTIIGYTQLIQRDYKEDNDEIFNRYFEEIKKGSLQMNDLIKSTLEYSRLNSSEIDKRLIDLNQIMESIKNAYINNSNVFISYNYLPIILGEENQILSLFQNLIENGVKYNEQSKKNIHISSTTETDKYLIQIEDNGIGIDEKYHNQIFTMFKRLHTNQQYEGTGLGLAICEKVVTKMNGKIWFESEVGVGTSFFVELVRETKD